MHRIDDPTAVPTLPAPRPAGTPGFFTGGAPGAGGFLATVVRYEFMNSLQEELGYVIEQSGLTLSKTDNTQLLQALRRIFINRTVVTANMTIYVNAGTGNDGNNGLTAGTAFQTVQAAINAVYSRYDWNGFGCTIQLADGTYSYNVAGGFLANFSGNPFGMPQFGLTLHGNSANPQNVILAASNANGITADRALIYIDGLTVRATGGSWTLTLIQGMGISAQRGGWIQASNIIADSSGGMFNLRSDWNGVISFGAGIKLTGNGQWGVFAGEAGLVWLGGANVNVTGWSGSVALWTAEQGRIEASGATFVGSATGPRYWALNCGCIVVNGGGPTFLPGSTAGQVTQGGQYN